MQNNHGLNDNLVFPIWKKHHTIQSTIIGYQLYGQIIVDDHKQSPTKISYSTPNYYSQSSIHSQLESMVQS